MNRKFISMREVCVRLGVSDSRAKAIIATGAIRWRELPGAKPQYLEEDVMSLVNVELISGSRATSQVAG